MGKSRINNKFFSDVSVLSPLSRENGYQMRIPVETDQAKASTANLPPAFRTVLIDAPPIFSEQPPFLAEPGFNGDDNTWMFTNHGPSTYVTNPDVLAIGCSITSSVGLPRIYSWPQLLASTSGQSVNVCSRPASGIAYQVFTAMQMMRHFGKPKIIYALFPDIFRAWVNVHGTREFAGKTVQEHLVWSAVIGAYVRPRDAIRLMSSPSEKQANSYMFRDFQGFLYHLPSEFVISKNIQAIRLLDDFCTINNIEFRFCSWSHHANQLFARLDMPSFHVPTNNYRKDLPMYWSLDSEGYEYMSPGEFICPDDSTCGHFPSGDIQSKNWLQAENDWHPGVHSHIHFAEHFLGCSVNIDSGGVAGAQV